MSAVLAASARGHVVAQAAFLDFVMMDYAVSSWSRPCIAVAYACTEDHKEFKRWDGAWGIASTVVTCMNGR